MEQVNAIDEKKTAKELRAMAAKLARMVELMNRQDKYASLAVDLADSQVYLNSFASRLEKGTY